MRETPVSDLNLRRAWGTVVNFCVALLLYYQETKRQYYPMTSQNDSI